MDAGKCSLAQTGRRSRRPGFGRARLQAAVISAALVLCGAAALADEVTLSNGDIISGQILTLKEGKLTIKTPYNESLEIAWGAIAKIRSDAPVEVVLSDGTVLKGTLQAARKGRCKWRPSRPAPCRSARWAWSPPSIRRRFPRSPMTETSRPGYPT